MKRFLALLLCVIMVSSLLSACGVPRGAGAVITACLAEEPKTIDPTLNASVDGASYAIHLFEGLTTVNKKLQVVPGMAKDWKISEDGLVYTFNLRDAKWSDGQPVKAQDFVFSWRRATNQDTAAEYSYQMYYLKNAAKINAGELGVDQLGVKAIDDKTLEVTLEAACSYFLNLTGFPTYFPLREDVVSKNPEGWSTSAATFVSNGPYTLTEWAHDSFISMKKNENYWNKNAILPNELKFVLLNDANTILSSFKTGEIFYSDIIAPEMIPTLKAEGSLSIAPMLGVRYVNFNNKKEPFSNLKVREALSLAIDRNYITEKVLQDGSLPAGAVVPPSIPDAKAGSDYRKVGKDYFSTAQSDYEANVAKAKQLLADAGYPDGNGFPTFSYMTNDSGPNVPIAEAIQQMYKENLGLNMQIDVQEWGVFQESRKNGEYDVCRGGWLGDYVHPMTFLDLFITTSDLNDPDFENSQYDSLIDQAKKENKLDKQFDLMHQAENILIKDNQAIAPITYYTEPQIVSSKLKGFVHSPLGFKYFMWSTLE